MSLSEPFIKRPVMTVLVTLSTILLGAYACSKLPVSDLPNVEYPVISVSASYPGMDATTMAASVASPLEKEFMTISGVQQVTSSSRSGSSSITLVFDLNKKTNEAATDVQSAITRAQNKLPSDMPYQPTYKKTDPNSNPVYYIALVSGSLKTTQIYDYAQDVIAQGIQILPGVSDVAIYGSSNAVRLNVNTDKLRRLGLGFDDVVKAVKANTLMTSAGNLDGSERTLTIVPDTQLEKAEDYAKIVVARRGDAVIHIKDVARCEDSSAYPDLKFDFWAKDSPIPFTAGVVLAITKASGANTVDVSREINAFLPKIEKELPGAITLLSMHDGARAIIESANDVKETLLIAFCLVVMVVFLFLGRVRETLIPAVAMPMAMLVTFVVMWLMDYSLDNLSLLALTLSVGFLVDDAIVFLENMVRRMEHGEKPLEAAKKSGEDISFTILSMTLSLAAVFLPMLCMSGQVGRVFREFSVVIIVAILASGVVSLSLTPMMCARMLKGFGEEKTFFEKIAYAIEQWCLKHYNITLRWFLGQKFVSVLIWILCLVGSVVCFKVLPKTFLPIGDSSFIKGVFLTAEGVSPKQMGVLQERVDAIMRQHPAVNMTLTVSGIPSGMLPANAGFSLAFLKSPKERGKINDVANQLNGMLFGIPGILPALRPHPVLEIQTGSVSKNQGNYAYVMYGVNADQVTSSGVKLLMKMSQMPHVFASVSSDYYPKNPQVDVVFDRERAAMLGTSVASVAASLSYAFSENYCYLINTPTQQYNVIVVAEDALRQTIRDIDRIYLKNINGQMLSIKNVTQCSENIGPMAVNHYNNFPSMTLYFDLAPGVPVSVATETMDQLTKEIIEAGVFSEFQGEAQVFRETFKSLIVLLFVAVFVMYVILGVLYESYVHPLTVLSSLPVATVGGLATLWLFDKELSLYAFVGIFMLMGIVKKNGIMMIDVAIAEQEKGVVPEEAVVRACMNRFRPIIMTTIAALMGAVPIALGWGADGESRMPLGLIIVGGLIVSQFITLYITPVLYLMFEAFQSKVLDRISFFARHL